MSSNYYSLRSRLRCASLPGKQGPFFSGEKRGANAKITHPVAKKQPVKSTT
jgi:hypothetical protein